MCLYGLLAALGSCRPTTSHVIIHSDMGDLTIRLTPAAGRLASAFNCDSCAIPRIQQDGFIQLNASAAPPAAIPDHWPLSNELVATTDGFFLIQGRRHTDQSLNKWEQTKGIKLPPRAREQYQKNGGALPFHGRCTVLGTLVAGREVLDRIAALPCDEQGKPLRPVFYKVELQP